MFVVGIIITLTVHGRTYGLGNHIADGIIGVIERRISSIAVFRNQPVQRIIGLIIRDLGLVVNNSQHVPGPGVKILYYKK